MRSSPTFFKSASAFRKWLEKNHVKEDELLVGFYKVGSGKANMSWSESVDQALCFGWIDGVRKSIDASSYQIRFTKRRNGSVWSTININKVNSLKRAGLMRPAGLKAFSARKHHRSSIYTYEIKELPLTPVMVKRFKANREAWKFFSGLAPSYRRTSIHYVMSAKQDATRIRRLDLLIAESAKGTNPWRDNKYTKK